MRHGVASLVLAWTLTGCGDDGGGPGDAAGDAATADAPADAPTIGPVAVRVTASGLGVAGVAAYFQNADSSLVAKVLTDAAGLASATMPPGGFVTVVNPHEEKTDSLITFADVKPGDVLELPNGIDLVLSSITVTLPTIANASQYEWHSTCGGATSFANPTSSITLANCGGQADVMVVPRDSSSAPLGSFTRAGITLADGANLVFTDAYTPVPDTTIQLTNVPVGYKAASIYTTQATTRGEIYAELVTPTLQGTTATVSFPRPTFPSARSLVQTTLTGGPASTGMHIVVDWLPVGAPHTFDLASTLLVAQTSLPAFDAAAHALTWGAGAGVTPDLVRAGVYASRDQGPSWEWRIAAPYTGAAVALPVLPAEIAMYNILASDTVETSELTTLKAPGGYDSVRRFLFSAGDLRDLSAGPSGRIAYHDLARQ